MLETLARVAAYILDDPRRAEALDPPPAGSIPQWLREAAGDETQAAFAIDASSKSVELAQGAVTALQEKAATHVTFATALVPFALAATALSLPPATGSEAGRTAAFAFFVLADLALVVAVAMAALAAGLKLGGGVSLERLGSLADEMSMESPGDRVAALMAAEAEALRYAALIAYSSGQRVAQDLYTARRYTLIALLLATIGMIILVSLGGGLEIFRPAPAPA